MNIELTPAEAALVHDLLKLYSEVVDYAFKHDRGCLCGECFARERVGEHSAATFDSLTEKTNGTT
jgi:hypothetical protein